MNHIDETAFIADGVQIVGDNITIGPQSSVWYNSVIRCDEERGSITIGARSNVQDLSTLHISPGCPVKIGDGVTIGHMCLIHGCTIGDNTLIGMGSIIMDGAVIGSNCIIGAGSLVTGRKVIPDGTMALGRPAKVLKKLSEQEIEGLRGMAEDYMRFGAARLAERRAAETAGE
ncbi:MAG: gamma carbonic anhydrase family protein [Mogibacterium sp.]|nr:gamma carbonic anhydrase family protein [Mogibacterium sp.]